MTPGPLQQEGLTTRSDPFRRPPTPGKRSGEKHDPPPARWEQASPPVGPPGRASRRTLTMISAATGTAIGIALVLGGRFEYRCTLRLQLHGTSESSLLGTHARDLATHIWNAVDRGSLIALDWNVHSDVDAGLIRIDLTTEDLDRGTAQLRSVAASYVAAVRRRNQTALATPGSMEAFLTEQVRALSVERDRAAAVASGGAPRTGDVAPTPLRARDELADRGRAQRHDLSSWLHRWIEAEKTLEGLLAAPPPSRGWASAEDRERAYRDNRELQQELAQLGVQLSNVKLLLLSVWQQASAPLDDLRAAAADLHRLNTDQVAALTTGPPRMVLERAALHAGNYATRLETFARAWTRRFTALRSTAIDAQAASILEAPGRLREQIGDFLFQSEKELGAIDTLVRSFTANAEGEARFHAVRSELIRRFSGLRSAHHRFEFAAADVDAANNFRLDAALRSARGLQRRTSKLKESIDGKLEAAARQRAGDERAARIAELNKRIPEYRRAFEEQSQAHAATQDRLDTLRASVEEFVADAARREIATAQARHLDGYRQVLEAQRVALEEERRQRVVPGSLEIQDGVADRVPVNLFQRVGWGLAAAATAMLVLLTMPVVWSGRRS